MSVIDVHITMGAGNFVPSIDPVTLSKKAGNTIKWYNDTAVDIDIAFGAGSPFPKSDYPIQAGKHTDSGSIKLEAGTTGYKYNISGGGIVTDPEVIVQP
jgi:hypothetical protein